MSVDMPVIRWLDEKLDEQRKVVRIADKQTRHGRAFIVTVRCNYPTERRARGRTKRLIEIYAVPSSKKNHIKVISSKPVDSGLLNTTYLVTVVFPSSSTVEGITDKESLAREFGVYDRLTGEANPDEITAGELREEEKVEMMADEIQREVNPSEEGWR